MKKTQQTQLNTLNKHKYWYKNNITVCVICGREIHNKKRVYNEIEKGINYIDNACECHFYYNN